MKNKQSHWFHIHLSTAIICMFFAAGLVWLNCRSTPIITVEADLIVTHNHRGWPYTYWIKRNERVKTKKIPQMTGDGYRRRTGPIGLMLTFPSTLSKPTWAMNLAIGFALLASVAFMLELKIQKRTS